MLLRNLLLPNSSLFKTLMPIVVALIAISCFSAAALALLEEKGRNERVTVSTDRTIAGAIKSVETRFKDPAHKETPDFQKHVAPLLGRLGCNARSCHGSFQGQGGFQLSLFGYDFETDHKSLLEEASGRVDIDDPSESLILAKPTSEDDHEGGLRYKKESWEYNLLNSWITNGAAKPEKLHKLDRLVIEPAELKLTDAKTKVELKATAFWSDGTTEDVTPLCRFHTNNDAIAAITEEGFVSTDVTPGDTHVVVSYDSAVVPVPVIHPFSELPTNKQRIKSPRKVDQLVSDKWNKLGLSPSGRSDDAMFLRRVSLDISGTLPTPDEIREFLADVDSDKRANKIDQLLESPGYAAWWTTFLCDVTENNTAQLQNLAYDNSLPSKQWYDWIHDRVVRNVPYDEIVAGIVLGKSRDQDESYREYCDRMSELASEDKFAESDSMPYYWMRREFKDPDTRAISFAHAFLGLRIQCAQCHKHPFDQWSQNDFKEFAKFFGGISYQNYNQGSKTDRAERVALLKELGIDPKTKNNGDLRKKLSAANRQGKTTPFGFVSIHESKPSREEIKKASEEFKEARKKNKKLKYKKPQITHATLLGAETIELANHEDIRVPVMEWMRSPDNPYFAKAIVNRVWAKYFGVGIVDPADDLNLANPPSNADLLDYLATSFIEHDFDMKWLHREIANSETYQLSWVPNESNKHDRRNFSRALPRRLPAEVVFDAIASAASNTKTNRDYRVDVDDRAISIPGTPRRGGGKKNKTDSAFALKVFGRSDRSSSCDCDRSAETSLIQTVYMQNDRDIHTMLTQKSSWINQMAVKHQPNKNIAAEQKQLAQLRGRAKFLNKNKAKAKNEKSKKRLEKQIADLYKKMKPLREKIAAKESVKSDMDVREVVNEAYLRTLSRLPTDREMTRCESHIRDDKDLINGVTGLMWALVNTKEFIVNH